MEKLSVGLCAPCDPPGVEQDLLIYFSEKFPEGQSLPYIAWLTHDMKWVHGFWGGRTKEQFEADLAIVEKSPLVPATEAVVAKLRAVLGTIGEHVEAGRWADVLAAARKVADLRGRCDEREQITEFVAEARDWIAARFDWAEGQVLDTADADLGAVQEELKSIARAFKGEPEAAEATHGVKALGTVMKLRKLEGTAFERARAKAAKTFAETRWAAFFEADPE